jgi:hypothetical protein
MNRRLTTLAAVAAVAIAAAGTAFATSGTGSTASDYTAVATYRLADHTPINSTTLMSLPLIGADAAAGGIPADATAVTLDIAVVNPSLGGYLTAWPSTQAKPTSPNVNYNAGAGVTSNLANVPVADGRLDIEISAGSAQIVVDLEGWYTPTAPAPAPPQTITQTLAGVASVATGGSFNSRATEVGTVDLPAGSYLVTLSPKATPIVQTDPSVQIFPSVHLYNQPKNAAFTGDVLDTGGSALESGAVTNADLFSSNSGVVTLTQDTTMYVYAFGYDSDSGEGTYQLDDVTVTATPISVATG